MKTFALALAALGLLFSLAGVVGCARDSAPLAPTIEAGPSARPVAAPTLPPSDALAQQVLDDVVAILDDIASGDPDRVDQGVTALEAMSPGISDEIMAALAGATGTRVFEIELPLAATGGGEHTVTITITGTITVKAGSTFTVAGAETEFLEDTTIVLDRTFEYTVDCGEGCEITSNTRTTKKYENKKIQYGSGDYSVDLTVDGKVTVDVKVKPCCAEGQTPQVQVGDGAGR